MEEVFKQAQYINPDGSIELFENYEVSNLGRVKSYQSGKEKILKPGICGKLGRQMICLRKDNKNYFRTVHRLVLSTFNSDGYFEHAVVDHIDSNPSNNRLDNLRWITYEENNSTEHAKQAKSKAIKGMTHSEEHKRKISEAKKGKMSGFENPRAQSCVYDNKTFGCIREAYEYAKEHGYTKTYEMFWQMIKKRI